MTTKKASIAEMAQAVKALAEKNYDKSYGWQVFVECYTDTELELFVKDCKSIKEAERFAAKIADIRTERYEGAHQ